MNISYDEVGDILYLDVEPPHSGTIMHEVALGVLPRVGRTSRRVEGLEIHHFRQRASSDEGLDLPVLMTLADRTLANA